MDRTVLVRHFDGNASGKRQHGEIFGGHFGRQQEARLRRDNARDQGIVCRARSAIVFGMDWIELKDVTGLEGFRDWDALGQVSPGAGVQTVARAPTQEGSIGIDTPIGA